MNPSLTDQYMRLVYDYEMDLEETLRDIMALLERVAPVAMQAQIDYVNNCLDEFEE